MLFGQWMYGYSSINFFDRRRGLTLWGGPLSLTIDHDTPQVMEITGLSMAAHAQAVVDPTEAEKALRLLMLKYRSRTLHHCQCRRRRMSAYSA
jgi:hypothetical protein